MPFYLEMSQYINSTTRQLLYFDFLNSIFTGLEISNLMVTKLRLRARHVQEAYFKNRFCKEKVIVSSNLQ